MDGDGPSEGVQPRARIDLAALRANARVVERHAAGRAWIAVVKANAYGHGAVPVARALLAAGASRLAVVTAEEASELRAARIASPLLVLGGARSADEADAIVAAHATAVLHHEQGLVRIADAAKRAGRVVGVQLELDTGMRRMGVPFERAAEFAAEVESEPGLVLEGVFTHFACADDPDLSSALEQIARFRDALGALAARGLLPDQIHAANSAGLLSSTLVEALPEATAVRPGLMLYGVAPAPHLGALELTPVMSLRAPVVRLHTLAAGDGVGYGATWRAPRPTRVATVALGYEDGVPWTAANRGEVWLGGARRPIVGRVSMDSVGVEVGDAPVELGDEAVFFGTLDDGSAPLRVEDAAAAAGTLSYELLVRVGRRVAREWVDGIV